jgi:hypothetical protein
LNVNGWDWWIVAGGALQVIGVAALVIDIVTAFSRLERYRKRGRTVYRLSKSMWPSQWELWLEAGSLRSMSAWTDLKRGSPGSEMSSEARRFCSRTGRVDRISLSGAGPKEQRAAIHSTRASRSRRHTLGQRRRLASVGAIALGVFLATIGSIAPGLGLLPVLLPRARSDPRHAGRARTPDSSFHQEERGTYGTTR